MLWKAPPPSPLPTKKRHAKKEGGNKAREIPLSFYFGRRFFREGEGGPYNETAIVDGRKLTRNNGTFASAFL